MRKGGVIVQRLLIEEIGVCLYRLSLGCRRCPVGFQLMAAYAALNCPRRHAARFLSGKFYPVPAFHEILTDDGLTGWGEPVLEGHCEAVLACVEI